MPRPIVAHISTQALQHNLRMVRLYAPHARVAAVIKASGYGHGTLRVAQALHDADAFALLNTEAAAQLRHAGLAHPIVMLEGMFAASEIDDYIALHLIPVLHQPEQLQWLLQAELPRPFDVWVKLNTGMNRLGFHPAQLPQVLQQLQSSGNVNRITLMTHFACADEASGVETQLASFNAAAGDLRLQRSLANSAALIDCADARGDWVRPGIMLYGSSPFADRSAAQLGLLPAMTLKSQLISVQNLNVGDAVGYGAGFIAEWPMRIGTVACGYADGYPRHAPTGTPVLVDGARTRLLGRVSMDMLAVDLGDLPQANIGSPVTLWGEGLPVDEVAQAAGTIGYELLCALAPRVPVIEE